MTCSQTRPAPLALSALAILALAARPAASQQPDEALVGRLAGLLAAADARRFDAPLLVEVLRHPSPVVRRQAALAAGRMGDTAAVSLLVPALEDSSEAVRAAAAFALGMLADERAVPPLAALIRAGGGGTDGQSDAHLEAVTALAKIGGESGARALADVLAGGTGTAAVPGVVSRALLEAWRLGPRAPVRLLVRAADAADPVARRAALYSLARLRVAAATGALFAALQDRDPEIRLVAARGVSAAIVDSARLDRRAVRERLRGLLADRDARIRINALRAIASFKDSAAAADVVPLLADGDVGVQVQAETTLGALGGSTAVAALAGRVTAAGFALRRQAVLGLAEASSRRGSETASALLTESDWRWRRVAAEAFGAARQRAPLEALLADRDGRVVAAALEGLGRVAPDGDAALRDHARRLLEHGDPAVRSVAADLLARRPAEADVDRLIAAYRRSEADSFNDARLAAVGALAAVARAGAQGRLAVVDRFLAAVPRSDDYLVRRLAADRFPEAAEAWGPAEPIATGRRDADYREVVRRYLLPALAGSSPQVSIETDRGTLVVRLLAAEAPLTVAAFLQLVDQRFFDGHRWHRVVPNFVVQDGDPRGDGWGGPGFVLRDEVNPIRYETGTMGMALSGPDTGGSQFFITHSAQPHLDGTYTVFGEVVSGVPVLAAIAQGDRIRSIHR